MGNKYDSPFMDENEEVFFERYSSALEQQETIIAEQHEMQVADKEFKFLLRYLEGIEEEYVVQGALLGCTKGTTENIKVIYAGESIESNPINVEENSRIKIDEKRTETINGFIPANIEDCKGGRRDYIPVKADILNGKGRDFESGKVNITSFGNCSEIKNGAVLSQLLNKAGLNGKENEILEAIKAGKGLCYCFMDLNNEWENLAMAGEYLTGEMPRAGVAKILDTPQYMKFNGKEGINMLSMLFCPYGGGIITAKESGQIKNTKPDDEMYKYMKDLLDNVIKISEDFDKEINEFKEAYIKNKSTYEDLAEKTGVPPELIAIIHYREGTTDYLNGTFNVYLHNGETLGSPTVNYPPGKLFYNFESAAKDALKGQQDTINKYNLTADSKDIAAMLCFAETYNGLGYYKKGLVSPYIFSGTNNYEKGKYVEVEKKDGSGKTESVYNANLVDKQVGTYLLLSSIL